MIRRQRGQADHTGATYAGKQTHGQQELRLGISSHGYGKNEHKLDLTLADKLYHYKHLRQGKVRFKYKDRESSFTLEKIVKFFFYNCSEINSIHFIPYIQNMWRVVYHKGISKDPFFLINGSEKDLEIWKSHFCNAHIH